MILRLLALCALVLLPLPVAMAQDSAPDERHVELRLVPETTVLRPGSRIWIAIEQVIDEGWHTYWQNPGDSGTAPRIDWDLPPGVSAGALLYPVPEKIPFGGLVNYGYEGSAVLLQEIIAGDTIAPGPLELFADIQILVCHDICIPEEADVSVTLNMATDTGDPRFVADAREKVPALADWPAEFAVEGNEIVITLTPGNPALADQTLMPTVEFFPLEWGVVENTAQVSASAANGNIVLRQQRGTRQVAGIRELPGVIEVETKTGTRQAFQFTAIQDRVTEALVPGGAAVSSDGPPNVSSAEIAGDAAGDTGISLLQAMLLALLGGVVLNLMPCVFPVLSIKALSSVKLSAEHPKLAAAHGFAYTLGILVTFAVIAAILILLKQAGALIGWGFQLQNPVVVTLLAWLLFVIGLNLVGVFEFTSRSLANIGGALATKQGVSGSFFTGILATLVATPCTAPFMGAAMGFALTQPPVVAMIVFLMLGLGLALPFLVLSLAPPLQKALPRPGAWMETFKQFLAFPMFASSVWLVWVLSQQAGPSGVLLSLAGMVAIVFAIWLWRRDANNPNARTFVRTLAVLALIAAFLPLLFLTPAPNTRAALPEGETTEAGIREGWSPEKLEALLQGDEPVFVEMTAAWCITCKVNEKVALSLPQTERFFADNGIHYLVGDWTNYDDTITRYLESYGRSGVPIYVFYGRRDSNTGQRPEPVLLPQLLTPAIVTGILSKGL